MVPVRRVVPVCAVLLVGLAGAPLHAQNPEADKAAAAHYQTGRALFEKGSYQEAYDEYYAAYQLSKRPLLLFHMARAQQRMGRSSEAVSLYQAYVKAEPDGKAADEARVELERLKQELAPSVQEAVAVDTPEPPVQEARAATVVPPPQVVRRDDGVGTVRGDERDGWRPVPESPRTDDATATQWTWIGGGAAALGAGVALDLLPASGSNGRLDALDFAPLVLYGVGVAAVVIGIL